ncbi:hypothetical protein KQX54_005305 [Cotesia glomerata]|uniref:Uncharacterized protein n=1 Tax=Cotesia glomerata TaxID=32391 RepID=A0AAV7IF55_COTGL|nr:hypothetical protein KQX54_005305 [Cotesia glomerata]
MSGVLKIITEGFSFVTFSVTDQVMETVYLESSWKNRMQFLKRRVVYLFREVTNRYRKKKGYTRFLTDEEKRWLANAEYDISTRTSIPYSC